LSSGHLADRPSGIDQKDATTRDVGRIIAPGLLTNHLEDDS